MTSDRTIAHAAPSVPGRAAIWFNAMLAVVAIGLVAAMVMAIRERGPWYDEFYTLYMTQPSLPPPFAWDRWLADNHPPLFYGMIRGMAWLGPTVEARRVVNLFLLAAAAAQIIWWMRAGALRRIAWVYAILLAGAWPAIARAAELRSTFFGFAAASVVVAALTALQVRAHPPHRREWAMLAMALLIAFNIHLATSMIVGGAVGGVVLRRMLAKDWRGTIWLCLAAMPGVAAILGYLILSFHRLDVNTRSFWTPPGFNAARWAMQKEVIRQFVGNPPATLTALLGFADVMLRDVRARRVSPTIDMAVTLAVGLGLGCAVMLTVHMWRPFVIDRYLVALYPMLAMILALGAASLLDRLRMAWALAIGALMTLAALIAIVQNLQWTIARPSWYGTARIIANTVRTYPNTRVHADYDSNRDLLTALPADNQQVLPFAYRTVAAGMGFPLASPGDHYMPRDCPTLFWAEHVANESVSARSVAQPLRAAGFPIARARLLRIGDGHVLVTWPAR